MLTSSQNGLRQYISQEIYNLIRKPNKFPSAMPPKNLYRLTNQFVQNHSHMFWSQFNRQGQSQKINNSPLFNDLIKHIMRKKSQSAFYRGLIESQQHINSYNSNNKEHIIGKQKMILRENIRKSSSCQSKQPRKVVQSHHGRASTCFEHNQVYLQSENANKYLQTKNNRKRATSSISHLKKMDL